MITLSHVSGHAARAALAVATVLVGGSMVNAQGYRDKLQVESHDIKAAVPPTPSLPPALLESMQKGTVRGASPASAPKALAAEVVVVVKQYRSRALDPVLLIDGQPAGNITGVEPLDEGTRLTFTVPNAQAVLKDGSKLAIQMGNQEATRAEVTSKVEINNIKPLDADTATKAGLPRNINR